MKNGEGVVCPKCRKSTLVVSNLTSFYECTNCGWKGLQPKSSKPKKDIPKEKVLLDTKKALRRLKDCFFLYLLGSVAYLVPYLTTIGFLLDSAAFLLVLTIWMPIGRSGFKYSQEYKSTYKWIRYGLFLIFIGFSAAVPILSQPTFPTVYFDFSLLVVYFSAFIIWLKICKSIRILGGELDIPKLVSSSKLYSLVGLINGLAVVFELFRVNTSSSSANFLSLISFFYDQYSRLFIAWNETIYLGLGLLNAVILTYASYHGYTSMKIALPHIVIPEPPERPQTVVNVPWIVPITMTHCPNCGHKLASPYSTICTNCGANLYEEEEK